MKITLPPFLSAGTYTIYSSNRISTSHKNHNIPPSLHQQLHGAFNSSKASTT